MCGVLIDLLQIFLNLFFCIGIYVIFSMEYLLIYVFYL